MSEEPTEGPQPPDQEMGWRVADLERVGFLLQQASAPHGQWTWLPLGTEFTRVLLRLCSVRLTEEGYEEVKVPPLVRMGSPRLQDTRVKFGERLYWLDGDEELALTWNSDVPTFSLVEQLGLQPPVRLFTAIDFFRNERSGEVGATRGRHFFTIDAHAIVRGLDAALDEARLLLQLSLSLVADTLSPSGWSLEISAAASRQGELLPFVQDVAQGSDAPTRVAWLPDRRNYYDLQIKVLWGEGPRAFQISNLQVDSENGPRFGLGADSYIVHSAPVARPERFAFAAMTLARAAAEAEWPAWPVVLSPVQVRLLPIAQEHVSAALTLARMWRAVGLRTDVDASPPPVGKRARQAKRLMVPYVGLVGPREKDGEIHVLRNDGLTLPLPDVATRELAAPELVVSSGLPVLAGRLATRL